MECRKERKWYQLSMLAALVLIALLALRPAGRVQAEEAEKVGWTLPLTINNLSPTKTIQVEAGQKFYISDFLIRVECVVYPTPLSYRKAVYSSSNSKVASVKKGCVTAKKVGTAKITAKYNKKKYVCTLKVVKKGSLKSTTTYKRMNTLANTIAEAYTENTYPTKIKSSNFLKVAKAVTEYRTLAEKYKKKLNGDRGYVLKTNKLAVPLASKVSAVESDLKEYAGDYIWDKMENPSGSISKVTAKSGSSTFTITLKNKLSEKQFYLLAFYYLNKDGVKVTFGKNPSIKVSDYLSGYKEWMGVDEFGDESEESQSSSGYALYTIKPGTAKITAAFYKNSKCTKAQKLIKGMEYTIYTADTEEGEYSFTAK